MFNPDFIDHAVARASGKAGLRPPMRFAAHGSLRLGHKLTLAYGLALCLPAIGIAMLWVGTEGWASGSNKRMGLTD